MLQRCLSTPLAVNGDSAASEDAAQQDTPRLATDLVAESTNPVVQTFRSAWTAYLGRLFASGYFAEEADQPPEQGDKPYSLGIVKRANLRLARDRPDILYSLPEDKIEAVVKATPPYTDRKIDNATKRLTATFIKRASLGETDGGRGSFQDLIRLVVASDFSLRIEGARAVAVDGELSVPQPDFLQAVTSLLPDIIAAFEQPATPEALEKFEAARQARELSSAVFKQGPREDDPAYAAHVAARRLRPSGAAQDGDRRVDRARFFAEKGWPAAGQNENVKPGDWFCGSCKQHNFASKRECFKCGAPRSAGQEVDGGRGGDSRPSFRDREPRGRFSRDDRSFDRAPRERSPRDARDGRDAPNMRPGDWACPACNAHNFASRSNCFKCDEPRADGYVPAPRASFSADRGDRRDRSFRRERGSDRQDNFRPGDWPCGQCGAHNFARNTECFKCGAGAGPTSGGGGSGGRSWSGGASRGAPAPYRSTAPPVGNDDWFNDPSPANDDAVGSPGRVPELEPVRGGRSSFGGSSSRGGAAPSRGRRAFATSASPVEDPSAAGDWFNYANTKGRPADPQESFSGRVAGGDGRRGGRDGRTAGRGRRAFSSGGGVGHVDVITGEPVGGRRQRSGSFSDDAYGSGKDTLTNIADSLEW
ncbi:hypothetical protein WJX72_009155 [[Myrmecia] bisecta]|uniref:RanBP2-type domain-containing protein n=1 Tax=[Myrmecia] bisecta TaxID=41462 RepID=A0AAW1QS19_9CHLO